jgi:5'-3' exonuclease
MEQTKKTILDGNSIGFLAQQCGAKLKAGEIETTAVFGFVQIVRDIVSKSRGSGILVLWDGYSWRKQESTEYKANRGVTKENQAMRKAYKSQGKYIRKCLTALGITQAVAGNLEADDMAAILSERYVKNGCTVQLYTRDRDWLQMVQPGVVWKDHQDHNRISHKKFMEETGYPDRFQFAEAKALTGDASDNIKGVGQIGEVKAKLILEIWGSVPKFLEDDNPAETWKQTQSGKFPKAMNDFHSMSERIEKWEENLRMMQLVWPEQLPTPENLRVVKGDFNRQAFEAICKELAFHSFLKDMDRFIHPFTPITGD